jgi:hypothetical protein
MDVMALQELPEQDPDLADDMLPGNGRAHGMFCHPNTGFHPTLTIGRVAEH